MSERAAPILVYGATGFTGRLVTRALARRGIRFAVAGRNGAKLEALATEVGAAEACVVPPGSAEALGAAVAGRTLVCACAGPFVEIGEPMLATCARAGVHYVDTTGEQPFVARALAYRATAEASGACLVPGMAFEIAVADWGAHLAAQALGGAVDAVEIAYVHDRFGTTRGTKRSIVAMLGDGGGCQRIGGALVREAPAARVRRVGRDDGRLVTVASFPSPEAVVTPAHTGARDLRTFTSVARPLATALSAGRAVVPAALRGASALLDRLIDRVPEGPDAAARDAATFEVIVEATKGGRRARVVVLGRDPYGLTAEIQAYAAAEALAGHVRARGLVAPSVAFDADEALAALPVRVVAPVITASR